MADDPAWLCTVDSAEALFATPFAGRRNAVRWVRTLAGDFAEVARLADAIEVAADRVTLDDDVLRSLRRRAGDAGRAAIDLLRWDLELLRERGHEPGLEWLRRYRRDDDPDLPTDVQSFHVDTANAPTETILCTYSGAPSEVLPRAEALRRVDEPALRPRLQRRFEAERGGDERAFAAWLTEHSFDLHFAPRPGARPFVFGAGELWRLAVQHPTAAVEACIHRAPATRASCPGRLLLIS
ncbi:MAG: hypothetical protein H6835_14855 [Planctomycetes bacterium]|nr:hypothetical protein [Planctomycetota bacterium]